MKYRALTAFDLDNTLLNDEKKIPAETVAALQRLRANGVLPVIATGRDRFEIADIIAAGQFDAIVSANGADVYAEGRQLHTTWLPAATVQKLAAWADDRDVCVAFSNHVGVGMNRINDVVTTNYRKIRKPAPPVDPHFYHSQDVTKGLLFLADNDAGHRLETIVRAQFPTLTFYRNSIYCLDVAPKGTTKASGLNALRTGLHLDTAPIFAFGDGNNDVPMLSAADYGIAMGNAVPAARAEADYVTDRYDQHGIVNALAHFGLLAPAQ
ncbi:Cof-type HAD-IIB family hydrolase [Schleiferilactobacillus shenzhenensis]|uniref:Uncharacterized protein n=1 Tax=Schleiferilactobacillus shenzhenensis LY-73 TaxID=1231336 RepID=U4TXK1_9LACO|nr:Cof-type HAD-IIB family hydrolase [Schleiferilactobacillus shenzhenensis]ERL66077.1 hypothetical protein L248_1169 [Schleiferilactobacillus shenzhenensis LY-73]